MKSRGIAAWSGTAALALGLAACGGGSSGAIGSTDPGSSATAEGTAPTTAAKASTAAVTAGALTPPGKHLKVGQTATVGWVPSSIYLKSTGAKTALKLRMTVVSIEKGTIDDFKNIELKADEKKSTPYYVTVKITALGKKAPPTEDDPDTPIDAIDDRDQKQGNVIFFGNFARCDDASPPKPFVSGKSYRTCLTYLIAGGGSIEKVQWDDGPAKANDVTAYFEKPIVWS